MRVMALDIGDVRTGIAISDPGLRVANPLEVLPTQEVTSMSKSFTRLIEDWEPELLLCGLPYSLSGEEGAQAQHIRQIAQGISERSGIECTFTDERLSSSEAKRVLREMGYDEKSMRGRLDKVAASIFLQAWLDKQRES